MDHKPVCNMSSNVISELLPVPCASPGAADIVGFGTSGVFIFRNPFNIQASKVINDFGYDGGWRVEKHVRLLADTTGDKLGDIVGFGENGVYISINNGDNTFKPPRLVLEAFSYSGDWRVEKHIRYMADIRGLGRADIVGFGDDGVSVSLSNRDGSFSPAKHVLHNFGYTDAAGGWKRERHPRFLADVTGNKLLDIVGFGENSVFIAKSKGDGSFEIGSRVLNDFCYSGGWHIDKHPRFVADLTGNGRADIIGFGDTGVYVSLNNGDGTFEPAKIVIENDFAYNTGWRIEKHPRFIADLTGNNRGDIVGFFDDGVYVSINNGDGTFGPVKKVIADFGYGVAGQWRVEKHPRFVVDVTGNGCADIIGFGENSVFVAYSDGKGNFSPVQRLTNDFSYNKGWTEGATVRWMADLYA